MKVEYELHAQGGNSATVYAANSTTFVDAPANELAIFLYDSSKFVSPSVYFEIIGNGLASNDSEFALYDIGTSDDATAAGSVVSGTEVTISGTSTQRLRSSNIASLLTSGNRFKVKLRNKTTASVSQIGTSFRIIVVDDVAADWTKYETTITMLACYETRTNVAYGSPGPMQPFFYDGDAYDGTVNAYLDVVIKNSGTAGTAYAELYNLTDATQVCEVSTANTTYTRLRSSGYTLTTRKKYLLRIKASAGACDISVGRVVLQATGSPITKARVYHTLGKRATGTPTSYSSTDLANMYLFTSANHATYTKARFSSKAGMTGAGFGRLRLWNKTDDVQMFEFRMNDTDADTIYRQSCYVSIEDGHEYCYQSKVETGTVRYCFAHLMIDERSSAFPAPAADTEYPIWWQTAAQKWFWNWRRMFYKNGLYWAEAGRDETTKTHFLVSTDLTDWSTPTTYADVNTFSSWFDGTYFHYARASTSGYYRRGVPEADATITWSAAEQNIAVPDTGDTLAYPIITVDSNGKALIVFAWTDATDTYTYPLVYRNANTDGTWATDSGWPVQLSTTASTAWLGIAVPLTSGKHYCVYWFTSNPIKGKLYNAGYGSEETCTQYNYQSQGIDVVSKGDNVYIGYVRASTYQNRFNKRTYGASPAWPTTDELVKDTSDYNNENLIFVQDDEYRVWHFMRWRSNNHWYYRRREFGSWQTEVDWYTSASGNLQNYSAPISPIDNKIPILWNEGAAAPYRIRFKFINTPVAQSFTIQSQSNFSSGGATREITIQSQSRFLKTQQFSIQSESRFKKTQELSIQSASRFLGTKELSIQSQSRFLKTQSFTTQSQSRFLKTQELTVTSQSRFSKTQELTIASQSDFVKSIHATLNGTIESTGGENCDSRGFDWGYATGVYPYQWTENGSYGIGTFAHQVTGLTRNVWVFFRAKAHNSAGWGYGSEQSFLATPSGTKSFDITSQSRFKGTKEFTLQSASRFLKGQEFTISSQSRFSKTQAFTIQSASRFAKTQELTVQSQSRFKKAMEFTTQSQSRFKKTQEFTISSQSTFISVSTKEIYITSQSRFRGTNEITITSQSKFILVQSFTIQSQSKFKRTSEFSIQSASRFSKTQSFTIQSSSRFLKTQEFTIQSQTRFSKTFEIAISSQSCFVSTATKQFQISSQSQFRPIAHFIYGIEGEKIKSEVEGLKARAEVEGDTERREVEGSQ